MRQLEIANRNYMPIYRYFQEINTLSLPSEEEKEVILIKQIKNGDRKALETLTIANLHFVVCVAKRFQNHGLTLQDLIMKGNKGLAKAAERFDETRGFKFICYAVWCIRQSIIGAIAANLRNKPIPLRRHNRNANPRSSIHATGGIVPHARRGAENR